MTATKAAIPSFLNMDSIAAILDIIRIYSAQPDVLTLSMQCLAHLLVNEDAAQEVGQLNGCTLLVKAMREHYTQEGLCEIDMILLDSLSSHPSQRRAPPRPRAGHRRAGQVGRPEVRRKNQRLVDCRPAPLAGA